MNIRELIEEADEADEIFEILTKIRNGGCATPQEQKDCEETVIRYYKAAFTDDEKLSVREMASRIRVQMIKRGVKHPRDLAEKDYDTLKKDQERAFQKRQQKDLQRAIKNLQQLKKKPKEEPIEDDHDASVISNIVDQLCSFVSQEDGGEEGRRTEKKKATEHDAAPVRKRLKNNQELKEILDVAFRQMSSNIFSRPVTQREADDYDDFVRCREDLRTMRKDVNKGAVESKVDLYRRIRHMYSNALMYNVQQSPIYEIAKKAADHFSKELGKLNV
ncbi:hypothetical protein L596_025379 [Steinernema carpocapsae]|uniref:Bromo domain-containing protein n=1 Tax=Steinernema carpocapsae TaxID=34508 RepID=A0A4U5M7N5_STECR|nr:hypothetical protein L596_025379 [Steinernema carpocapsae]